MPETRHKLLQASSYAEAKATSARAGKPILVVFSTDEIASCRAFEKAVTHDRALSASLSNVVLVCSMPNTPTDLIALRGEVSRYPTFVLKDSLGQEFDRWSGFRSIPDWAARLDQALAVEQPIDVTIAEFRSKPTVAAAIRLAESASEKGNREAQWRYLDQAMRLEGEKPKTLARERLRVYAGLNDRISTRLESNLRDAETECADDPECLLEVGWIVGQRTYRSTETARLAQRTLERIAPFDVPELEWRRLTLASHLIWELERDVKQATAPWREYLSRSEIPDAHAVVALSQWAFEDLVAYDLVLEFGIQALAAPLDRVVHARLLDAMAEAHFKSGQLEQAIANMREAVALEPENLRYRATIDAWLALQPRKAEAR